MRDLTRARALAAKVVEQYQKIHDGPMQMRWALQNLIADALLHGDQSDTATVSQQTIDLNDAPIPVAYSIRQ